MPRRKKNSCEATKRMAQDELPAGEELLVSDSARRACQVRRSPQVGRYLVARGRLRAGDLVLEDEPLVVGPCQDTEPVCIACCSLLATSLRLAHRCGGCGWPICGGGCPGLQDKMVASRGGHTTRECKLLQALPPPDALSDAPGNCAPQTTRFNLVTPLRCLLLQEEDARSWEMLVRMESHDSVRKRTPSIWDKNQSTVVEPILATTRQFSQELIHTVCGILEVNCFSVGGEGVEARALYSTAYLLQHDCVPNTIHYDSAHFSMTFRAAVDIAAGATVTLAYTSTLNGTARRRAELRASKFFDCCCARCSSDTELLSWMSGVKCSRCEHGWLLPTNALLDDSDWKCRRCEQTVNARLPLTITQRSAAELENIKDGTISDYERLVLKYEPFLHPNHSTLVKAKYMLSQMYGKTESCLINHMSEQMLKTKYDICIQLLQVFDIIEPGLTRIRGVTLYEAHAPLLLLTQMRYLQGKIDRKRVKSELNRVKRMLAESVTILDHERPESMEGRMCQAAREALQQPGLHV